ncbi:MAG TPA: response regulator transcription factor [Roseiflexaceae bacterium]|nr:response regulator transcription factor [Roseiflexaceae bacterium]
MQSATILVVDDEPPILDLIVSYLRADGFSVHTAQDGPAALAQARAVRPDLIVLDVMLPGMDGMEVCRRIQQEFDVYILMLTARAEEIDKIVGLSVGADDYLTKPFSPRELVMRVKAILRRSRALGPRPAALRAPERPALRFDELVIDPDTREVWHEDSQIELTPREFDLLYALAEQPGRVFNRDQLLERVWGHDFAGIDRVVDVHIGLLRRKLEDDPANPTVIQTVRGVGYKFVGRRR